MTDVSSTIIVGEWTITLDDGGIIASCGGSSTWLTDQEARDLAQALQVWIERNAHGAG